jgi:hypothetical protein
MERGFASFGGPARSRDRTHAQPPRIRVCWTRVRVGVGMGVGGVALARPTDSSRTRLRGREDGALVVGAAVIAGSVAGRLTAPERWRRVPSAASRPRSVVATRRSTVTPGSVPRPASPPAIAFHEHVQPVEECVGGRLLDPDSAVRRGRRQETAGRISLEPDSRSRASCGESRETRS